MSKLIDFESYPISPVLDRLLQDKTTKQNIIFATDAYLENGPDFAETAQITVDKLLGYMKKAGVTTGSVFLSKNKTPLDRSTVWRRMKALCERAGVDPRKVFPHSLRHLFARVFYSVEKDLLRLADILGHASVNTTRIYTMEAGRQHMKLLERVSRTLLT